MEPKIVSREQEFVVGMGGSFIPKSVPEINQLWGKFLARRNEIKNAKPGIALGICCKSHPAIERKDVNSIIYIAAVPVTQGLENEIPEGMVSYTISAGKYAVFTHKGALQKLPETLDYIWGEWASSAKFKRREAADFELYDERFDSEKLEGEIDIYVPIEWVS